MRVDPWTVDFGDSTTPDATVTAPEKLPRRQDMYPTAQSKRCSLDSAFLTYRRQQNIIPKTKACPLFLNDELSALSTSKNIPPSGTEEPEVCGDTYRLSVLQKFYFNREQLKLEVLSLIKFVYFSLGLELVLVTVKSFSLHTSSTRSVGDHNKT